MAIDFDGSQRLEKTSFSPLSTPMSFSCWVDTDNITSTTTIWSQGNISSSSAHASSLIRGSVSNDPHSVGINGGNEARQTGMNSTGYQCCTGVFAASNDRRSYIDGNKTTNTTTKFFSTYNTLFLAEIVRTGSGLNLNGRLAEFAFWNRALTDDEEAILSLGYSAEFVPNGLVHYWKLLNNTDLVDLVGGLALTAIGSPASADHPRIIYLEEDIYTFPSAAGIGASGAATTPAATASGAAKVLKKSSGEPSLAAVIASGATKAHKAASGTPSIAAVTTSGVTKVHKVSSGAASTPAVAASGVASQPAETASGAANTPTVTASGAASARKTASGTPSIPVITASGAAKARKISSGAATAPSVTASGAASVEVKSAAGAASVPAVAGSGVASVKKTSSGAASITPVAASGAAKAAVKASGAANLPAVAASGVARAIKKSSGEPTVPAVIVAGTASAAQLPTPPFVPNTWQANISALGVHHLWKLNETTGDALDTGATAGLDMIESSGSGNRWRLAPGPIRGQPREYALWGSQSLGGGLKRTSSGLAGTGFATGVFGAVIHVYSTNNKISYLIQQIYDSNISNLLELTVELDGAFQMRVGKLTSNTLTARTAAGLAIDGTSFVVMGVQRGDGTGIRIYVDGVDVTATNVTLGTGSLDSFPGDLLTGSSASALSISTNNGVGDAHGGALISNPFVFVNSVPNTTQIATLAASAIIDTTQLSDYFETVFSLSEQNALFWVPGWVMNANNDMMEVGINALEANVQSASAFTGLSSLNNPESGGVGKQIVSQFNNYYSKYGATNSAFNSFLLNTSTVGTFNFIGRIGGFNLGGFNTIFNYANGGSPGGNFTAAFFHIVGASSGYKFAFRLQLVGGDFFQAVSDSFITADADAITMFTVVQGGSGVLFYIDGVLVSTDDTSSGTTFDANDWTAAVDAQTGTTASAIGGGSAGDNSQSNFEPNEVHDLFMLDKVLTATEIATLWDAVNGVFPSIGVQTSSGAATLPAVVASGATKVIKFTSGASVLGAIVAAGNVGTEGAGPPDARFESVVTIDARFESTLGVLSLIKANFSSSSFTIKGNF